MKAYTLFFLTILFMITFSATAQQALINGEQSATWDAETRPNIEQTMKIISDWRNQGKNPVQISEMLNKLQVDDGTGAISGSVLQSDGHTPIAEGTQINVYDMYGFYEGSSYISGSDTLYQVGNLAPGMHYVQTYSYGNYVNKFYMDTDDWRQATLVQTFKDSTTSGINFRMELGKVITGKVLIANSLEPLTGAYAYFYLYDDNAILDQDYNRQLYYSIAQDGSYSLAGIPPGNYKLKLFIDQYSPAYYNNQPNLAAANIIQLSAQTDSLKFINFLMNPIVGVQDGYEANNVVDDAYEFSIGETLTPQINPAGDIDFFTFTANQGDSLDISLQAQSIESRLYPYLILYDSTGTYLINNWLSTNIDVQKLLMPYSGRYYLRVSHQSNQEGGDEFFYNLSVNYHLNVTQTSASISGYVYLNNESTPYSGPGYYIQLFDKDGIYWNEYFFTDSVYVINKIPAGIYKMDIYPPKQGYLSEWYEDAATIQEATEIIVSDQDSVTDINFVLDKSGGISGRLFLENYLSDYTDGGSMYLYRKDSPVSNASFGVSADAEGLFTLSGIKAGDYTLRFDPQGGGDYPSVWYGDVGSQGQAALITVAAGDTTDNITLIVKTGGIIQGFITMADDMAAVSSDSLLVTINMYDEAGFVVGGNQSLLKTVNVSEKSDVIISRSRGIINTFSGGYRTSMLYPGFYKLQILPQTSTLSSWYYSSGSHFDDPGSQMVEVKSDSVHEVPAAMNIANGGISGVVYRADGLAPTSQPGIVYAYDATGHMVQSVTLGIDPQTGQLLDTGHYLIGGLVNGTYYVMFSSNSAINDLREAAFKVKNNRPVAIPIQKLLISYTLNWYPNIVVENSYTEQLFFLPIPDGAVSVNVSGSSVTDGIDFNDIYNSISPGDKTIVPSKFEISSVYPNPFNPVTTLTYNVPNKARVKIDIFDILGQKVATVLDDIKSQGMHKVEWNGKNNYDQIVSSGIYIARLQAAGIQSSKKMVLIR